eukprot:1572546-Pyramimonas_sp.AAC.1
MAARSARVTSTPRGCKRPPSKWAHPISVKCCGAKIAIALFGPRRGRARSRRSRSSTAMPSGVTSPARSRQ